MVRFGYAASTALRYGVGTVRLVLPVLLDERLYARVEELLGRPIEQVLKKWAEETEQIVTLTDEAHRLADEVHS
jgi:acyl dehydratase